MTRRAPIMPPQAPPQHAIAPAPNLPIESMLVLSTAHLTPETCNSFLPAWDGPAWAKGDFGWFVYTANGDTLPTDLEGCFHLAWHKGIDWIMFDRDAPTIAALPVFDWEQGA